MHDLRLCNRLDQSARAVVGSDCSSFRMALTWAGQRFDSGKDSFQEPIDLRLYQTELRINGAADVQKRTMLLKNSQWSDIPHKMSHLALGFPDDSYEPETSPLNCPERGLVQQRDPGHHLTCLSRSS